MPNDSVNKISQSVSPRWCVPSTVEGFRTNPPNEVLLRYARELQTRRGDATEPLCALDIGGGAGRNAVPLAKLGFRVTCADLSAPMLAAAEIKCQQEGVAEAVSLILSPMAPLPFADQQFDLVIAHGIWNLAQSGAEFRAAIGEAARVARPGAGLFLFTFSQNTIPEGYLPVDGEEFVFTQFNGEPQCFLSEDEIVRELRQVGFVRDSDGPLTEYNRPLKPRLTVQGPPVLYEGTFTRESKSKLACAVD